MLKPIQYSHGMLVTDPDGSVYTITALGGNSYLHVKTVFKISGKFNLKVLHIRDVRPLAIQQGDYVEYERLSGTLVQIDVLPVLMKIYTDSNQCVAPSYKILNGFKFK